MQKQYFIRTCTDPEMYVQSYWHTGQPDKKWSIEYSSNIDKAMIIYKNVSVDILPYVHENYPDAEYVILASEDL